MVTRVDDTDDDDPIPADDEPFATTIHPGNFLRRPRIDAPPDPKGCVYRNDESGLFLELYIIMTTIEGSGSFRDPVLCIQDDSTRRRRPGQFEVIHDRPWLMSTSLRVLRGIDRAYLGPGMKT